MPKLMPRRSMRLAVDGPPWGAAAGWSLRPSSGAFRSLLRLYDDHDEEDTWNL
jgi:hypothetical protein